MFFSSCLFIYLSIQGLHNNVHVWVGGELNDVDGAPQDPVFFFHHCYIDYFWEQYREKQNRRGVDPENDYPPNNRDWHVPDQQMQGFPWIRNRQGLTNVFTRWYFRYEDAPDCSNNCYNSSYLFCNNNLQPPRCVPYERSETASDFQARSVFGASSMGALAAQLEGPVQRDNVFSNIPFIQNDPRNTARRRRSVSKNVPDCSNNCNNSPHLYCDTTRNPHSCVPNNPSTRRRRRVSNTYDIKTGMNSHAKIPASRGNSNGKVVHIDGDIMNQPITNSFSINGVEDRKLWNWFPVRIIHSRPHLDLYDSEINEVQFPNADLYYVHQDKNHTLLPATFNRKSHIGSGANKIYVQVHGITYNGRYENYAIVDDRQLMEMTYTYVAIKKPTDNSKDRTHITASDSEGRVCRPRCLIPGSNPEQYRPCSGEILSSHGYPKMMADTYEEAVSGLWKKDGPTGYDGVVFLEFHCDSSTKWPWMSSPDKHSKYHP